jgi:hypothetical protein
MQIPNSTKVFPWRACNGILPTKDNLKKMRVTEDHICIFCNQQPETLVHILWECPSAVDVWGACGGRIQKSNTTGATIMDVMKNLKRRCSGKNPCLVAIIAKKI